MADTEPLMYAELLSNIHQISVVVALETECNHKTKAYLSADGVQFTIHHEGKDTTLNLPGEVASKRQLQLDIPSKGSKELSWRFPVAGTPQRADLDLSLSHDAPWPAKDLGAAVEFHCRGCQAVLVKEGAVKEWRDLPSENWAEMMDFWHCHKPEQPANETARPDGLENRKGYGANTKFNAQPGIGFVDVATFLLSAADLPDVKVSIPIPRNRGHRAWVSRRSQVMLLHSVVWSPIQLPKINTLLPLKVDLQTLLFGAWVTRYLRLTPRPSHVYSDIWRP